MANKDEPKPVCGIVMPISELDGCLEDHWVEVREILEEAIEVAGFDANLVSNADDVGIIQKRIIQNLYDNPIVVCDVSGKNPNVMFELGLRLAFDKPTIIVKDDKTTYSFDTASIEHLEYPRDLRFSKIVEFKIKLAEKIQKTYDKSKSDQNYTTFLKHFGEFKVAKIEKKEVSGQEFILDELRNLRAAIGSLDRSNSAKKAVIRPDSRRLSLCMKGASDDQIREIADRILNEAVVRDMTPVQWQDHKHLQVNLLDAADRGRVKTMVRKEFPKVGIPAKPLTKRKPK